MHHSIRAVFTGLLAAVLPFSAQAAAGNGGQIYYSGGINTLELGNFQPSGYDAFPGWTWGQGGGLYVSISNILVGAEYQGLAGVLTRNADESLALSGDYGLVQLGYVVWGTPQFQIYPYAGVGLGRVRLNSSADLKGLLDVSQGSTPHMGQMQANNLLVDLGLGVQYSLPIDAQNAGDTRGLVFGLRGGYLFAPLDTRWQHNQLPVAGGPKLAPSGFYLRGTLGFGAYQ